MEPKKIYLITLFVGMFYALNGFKIDRVILSSDTNPMYLQFWPLVARAWTQLIGIKPTLILIAEEHVQVDESVGDVVRLKPIDGVSTASYAQIVRLLAPIYFENEICLISDIDMLPINRDYFVNSVKDIPEDTFVVYRDLAYGPDSLRFPMCYNAGKGYLFKSIFKIDSIDKIPRMVQKWVRRGWGWETDEIVLYTHVRRWKKFKNSCVFLGHTSMTDQRIDRADWRYDKEKLKNNYYIDSHMVRPLEKYYDHIKELADDLGLFLESGQ